MGLGNVMPKAQCPVHEGRFAALLLGHTGDIKSSQSIKADSRRSKEGDKKMASSFRYDKSIQNCTNIQQGINYTVDASRQSFLILSLKSDAPMGLVL